jgi:ADP-glucose pyrophosphorylase
MIRAKSKNSKKNPKSEKYSGSNGIYKFTWKFLKNTIKDDENNESDQVFCKNVIPAMLRDGRICGHTSTEAMEGCRTIEAF